MLGWLVGLPTAGLSHKPDEGARYRLSLEDRRGKVVAVTFIDASCADTCPLLTAKMAGLQARLGGDFGPRVFLHASRGRTRRTVK